MADNKLSGIIAKNPRQGAPSFVVGSLSFKVDEFIDTLRKNAKNGWVNCNLKTSRDGKIYVELDTWEPSSAGRSGQSRNSSSNDDELGW